MSGRIPALERAVIELRALELALVLYYSEDIKREVIGLIEGTDRLIANSNTNYVQRAPIGSKKQLEKALRALAEDGAITEAERQEIVDLTDFRNDIGHRIDQLFADMEQSRFAKDLLDLEAGRLRQFDHSAVERLRQLRRRISDASLSSKYVYPVRFDGWVIFGSAEKALLDKIERQKSRIVRLSRERRAQRRSTRN